MRWERANDYQLRSGQFVISKASVAGIPRYTLWSIPKTMHATYDSADAAKRAAERLLVRNPAGACDA